MPLDEQILDVVFQTGIDEQHDDRHVQPGALLSAINVRYDKELGIKHRPGNTILSASSDGAGMPASSRAMLATHKDELLLVDGTSLHTYVPGKGEYSKRGRMPLPNLSQQVVSSGVRSSFNGDVAASSRYAVYVWDDGGPNGTPPNTFVYYSARDLVSGAEVAGGVLDTNNHFHPRVCHVGSDLFIVTMTGPDNGTGKADVVAYALQGPSAAGAWTFPFAAATIANDNKLVGGVGAPHALTAGATGQYIIAYQASATSAITFRVFTGTTNTSTGTQAEANNLFAIRLSYTQNENLWCAYRVATTGVRVCARLATNVATSVLASTTVTGTASLNPRNQIGVTRVNATTCAFAFTQPTTGFTGTGGQTVFACKMTTAGVLTANSATYWARLQSDVIVNPLDGKVYAWLVVGPPGGQLSSVFCDLRVEGLNLPGTSWAIPHANATMRIANDAASSFTTIGAVSSIVQTASGKFLSMVSELRALTQDSALALVATGRYNYSSALVDMAYFDAWIWAEVGQSTVFAGGVPTQYDGKRPVECGFLYSPEGFTLTNAGAGGVDAGTHGYVLTYRYIDAQGQVHESAPTATKTITLGAGSNVTVAIPTYGTSRMWGDDPNLAPTERVVGVNIYRSTATATSGPFYLVASDATAPSVSPQTEAASYTDSAGDAAIISQPQLYTGRIGNQSAILSNVAPPALSAVVEHKNRLFGIDPTGKNIWFTKFTVDGEGTGSKWCDEFTIPYTGSGTLTSLASLDDKLVAFTHDRVYVLYGDGPTDGLQNNDFTGLQRVTSDIGGVAPKGMVLTEDGLYFRSSVGIYLLSRGLEIKWIGRIVQDTVDSFPVTNYAVVHPSGSQVFFGLSDGVGTRLMFDDNVKAWGRDAIDDSASNENAQFASSVRLNGKLYLVDTLGTTYVEDTAGAVFTDNGVYVPMTVEMAWVKGGSIQGFQRVWRAGVLGRSISPHDLKISIGTDYSPSYAQTHTFPWATLSGLTLEAVKVRVVRALCESVRVKLETLTPSSGVIGTGESASFAGVTFELGVNKHMKPQAASGAA